MQVVPTTPVVRGRLHAEIRINGFTQYRLRAIRLLGTIRYPSWDRNRTTPFLFHSVFNSPGNHGEDRPR